MKVVRLNTSMFRQWRNNTPYLVTAEGEPVRELSQAEERITSELAEQARRNRTTIEKEFQPQVEGGPPIKVRAEAEIFGSSGETVLVKVFVDGQLKLPSRTLIRARLLKEHGECQVRGPNNVVITTIRDPKLKRPTPQDAMRTAPKPENCTCKDWGEPHPGRHHPICMYNKMAPADEQALSTQVEERRLIEVPKGAANVSSAIAKPADGQVVQNSVVNQSNLHSPASCPNGCLAWAWPPNKTKPIDESEHHPVCQYFQEWEHHTRQAYYVCDLETGKAIRVASEDEIAEAELNERRTTTPTITIGEGDGKEIYSVLPEGEADLSSLQREKVTPNEGAQKDAESATLESAANGSPSAAATTPT